MSATQVLNNNELPTTLGAHLDVNNYIKDVKKEFLERLGILEEQVSLWQWEDFASMKGKLAHLVKEDWVGSAKIESWERCFDGGVTKIMGAMSHGCQD